MPSMRLLAPMTARDPGEAHRAATPLELVFGLTFVVAVAAGLPEFLDAALVMATLLAINLVGAHITQPASELAELAGGSVGSR